jgi:hypothetical protein
VGEGERRRERSKGREREKERERESEVSRRGNVKAMIRTNAEEGDGIN